MAAIGARPEFFATTVAVWESDAIFLPVDESAPAAEIASLRRTFRPAAILAFREGRLRVERGSTAPLRYPGAAMIRLTSGTTGAPRGALVTPAQVIADGLALLAATGLRPGDASVVAVPLGHAYGFSIAVMPLFLQGTPAILLERALPSLVLRALRSRRPALLSAVPYLVDLLARQPGAGDRRERLLACVSAGAPLPAKSAAAFRRRFGAPVWILYGATEAGAITFDREADSGGVEGRVGRPVQGVRLTIDRRARRLVVEGPAVARGYVPGPSDDLDAGRFRTADLAKIDEAGRVHLTGRLSSLVNVSGRKVNPREVELALLSLKEVDDAVALGVADALRGEMLTAWVVARRGANPESIRAALSTRLSGHKVPRAIRMIGRIPRTTRGKINRLKLLTGK